jgi:hypothetical protein
MEENHLRFEGRIIGMVAILTGAVLAFVALAGPLAFNLIRYKVPPSAIYQAQGQDLINLVLIMPICVIGGALALVGSPKANRWLMLPPIYLMYASIAYGVGMEWSDPRYTGNSEKFVFLFVFLMIAGLLLLLYSLSRPKEVEAPVLGKKGRVVYSVLFVVFLLAFAGMWCGPILEIMRTGTTQSYDLMPTGFWTVRVFDLGVSIPLGLLSVYLLWTRPRTGFPVQLLFYGFFITQITAVLAMAAFQMAARDPSVSVFTIVVFACIAVIVYGGYFYVSRPRPSAKA